MDFIKVLVDLFLHLDKNLGAVIQSYGLWTYLILFALVFLETGLVVTPFLPGDSLLFVAGAFAASGSFNLVLLFIILGSAAILGDTVNYQIGHWVGPKAFSQSNTRLFKKENLERTQQFYHKHGGKTIIIARFIPVIRTFAPFVAGIGKMKYLRFLSYNLIGGIGWVAIILMCGYLFGNLPVVRNNFSFVILAIILISILPAIISFLQEKRALLLKQ
ncbi:putative membrane-associated protein [Desulfosporosinus acidiphilus SJ4]|uniref:Putative membrane-associated protein n=1 Tax=Desulfosporosinus acidiphilus (strain DSM 22704 / JCM 16185 / SJ4) TaxID=646529 RepID=I4DAH4_DESAJ|nr:DedA family protein [Desulfosporosinus acidiphilus]AFM42798.1 putative membrane-associated protein [Desulfosporosinus acidiphilus SJ4]